MLATLRSLLLSSHPGPTATVTVLAVVLGAGSGLGPGRVVLLGVAFLLGQLSIGFSNDWVDAARDRAVERRDKPVARGDVSVTTVRTAAWVTAALTVPASFGLGWQAAVAHLVLVASGWAYNLGLKRTAWSVAPFVLSFGLLPAVVTLAAQPPAVAAPWALAVGGVFGVAIHFTNVLPDLEDDATTGVDGLPHRLGRVVSGVVAFVALAVAALLVVLGPVLAGTSDAPGPLALVALGVCLAVATAGVVLVVTRPPGRLLFQLIIVASLVVAAQLALSGTVLTA
ncbi:4-hydroxybenzoate polyprenyltransferase-like prenyltransferase [Sanguibacter keddieii DSM 10542]|uniref:4-hydroxybenzoate polyprenyltransferase-like prenyltransferase n=1 Tax=Sanguibacter keddieii (strain ATCC 51767 / DSM 10542 / NCFB 3025 / ST-74) TaxID=446469 RepID=D1BH98_SANKS|nr:UbiA family prenyltransferase [Sanguibacter keddieii]ACZ21818.1 4-hydroxybenzoate polyprenyltransferase-like prenyltransferase [Sanguibacter keddieii DSM 10542]